MKKLILGILFIFAFGSISYGAVPSLGVDYSYGWHSVKAAGTLTISNPVTGIGAFLKIPYSEYTDIMLGYHYVGPSDSWTVFSATRLSYAHLDICANYSYLTGSLGLVYPMLTISSGINATTNLGYEFMLGVKPFDFLTIGAKQLAFTGNVSGTSFDWTYFSWYANVSFPLK